MAEPTSKEVPVEDFLKEMFGFDRTVSIRDGKCIPAPIGCGKDITGFKDPLSAIEFRISGLCQECQDKIFGGAE
jgi:hypothetical protein